jgi:tetratricopeptide (TPR) repeat protein
VLGLSEQDTVAARSAERKREQEDSKDLNHRNVQAPVGRPRYLIAVLGFCAALLSLTACSSSKSTPPADRLVNAGLVAQQHGNLTQAVVDYQAAIKANPLQLYAYYDLGVIYQQENDYLDASSNYQKALVINPKYQSALFNLAILETSSNPGNAVSLYEQLLSLNPNDSNVLFNLGLVLRAHGDSVHGDADIAKAVKLNPALAAHVPKTTPTKPPATTPTTSTTTPGG